MRHRRWTVLIVSGQEGHELSEQFVIYVELFTGQLAGSAPAKIFSVR